MARTRKKKLEGRFVLRSDRKPNREGKHPVYLDYCIGDKHARASTGIWVEKDAWDEALHAVKTKSAEDESYATRLNGELMLIKMAVDNFVALQYADCSRPTIAEIRRLISGKVKSQQYNIGKANKELWEEFTEKSSEAYKNKMRQLWIRDKERPKVPDSELCGEIHGIRTPHHWMYKLEDLPSGHPDVHYEFLLEYDIYEPHVGIYYGCKAIWRPGSRLMPQESIRIADEDWSKVKAEVVRVLNTVFLDIDFSKRFKPTNNASNFTYWPFWVTLNDGEDIIDVGLRALRLIRHTYSRCLNRDDAAIYRCKETNAEPKKLRVRYTPECRDNLYQAFGQLCKGMSKKDPNATKGREGELFRRFMDNAVNRGWFILDKSYPDGFVAYRFSNLNDDKHEYDFPCMMRALCEYIAEDVDATVERDKKFIPWQEISDVFLKEDGGAWTSNNLRSQVRELKGDAEKKLKKIVEDLMAEQDS